MSRKTSLLGIKCILQPSKSVQFFSPAGGCKCMLKPYGDIHSKMNKNIAVPLMNTSKIISQEFKSNGSRTSQK